jgi:phosphoribosylamine--glycine ligase
VLTPELEERALGEIVRPTIDALAAAGTPYVGVLYAGLMLTADGPKLIEYNVRFGDPECQVLMMRYTGDLAALLLAVAEGKLADTPAPTFSDDVALTVVMAASGYPGAPETGGAIASIDAAQVGGAVVFQAGTALEDGHLVSSGGRVLAVTATGTDVAEAQRAAYAAVAQIDFPTGFYRSDIGAKALIDG